MMRLSSGLALKLLAIILLGFFLIYWVPFSHALPESFPSRFGGYRTFQASMVAVWVMVALGLNILTGYNGQISLGHTAFVATGGYTVAILMVDHPWPFGATSYMPLTVIMAGITAGALGLLVGLPALRLRGPYLAIATMAMALAMPQILKKYDGLTHGNRGINLPSDLRSPPGFLENILNQDEWVYFLALFTAMIMTLFAWNIIRSRVGRAFVAIRDSEVAAAAMGINVARYKTLAFAISAFLAGIAGGTYVQAVGYISPESFSVLKSIDFLTTIVVGGLASILGSVVGAITLVMVPELPGLLGMGKEGVMGQQAPWAMYGVSLILVVILLPHGIAGALHSLGRWLSALRPAHRVSVLAGVALGIVAAVVVGKLAGGGVSLAVGVAVGLAITYPLWLPALRRSMARGYSRWIGALRGSTGQPGLGLSMPEAGPSDKRSDAEKRKGGDSG
jgi:branched-chain amino acid transport system permease protein